MYCLAYSDHGGVVHDPVVALHTVAKTRAAPRSSAAAPSAAARVRPARRAARWSSAAVAPRSTHGPSHGASVISESASTAAWPGRYLAAKRGTTSTCAASKNSGSGGEG